MEVTGSPLVKRCALRSEARRMKVPLSQPGSAAKVVLRSRLCCKH